MLFSFKTTERKSPWKRVSHPFAGKTLWDGASSSIGFWRCFCVPCTSTVPCYSPFPQTPRTCVLVTTNDSGFNSSISQLFLLTPSRWCHHVVHLFEGVSYRRLFMFPSRTAHIQQNSFLSPLERLFSPHFWNITPESIYTFKFSQFLSYHPFSIIFAVSIFRKKAQIVIVYI